MLDAYIFIIVISSYWIDPFITVSFIASTVFILKSILSYMTIPTSTFFWFPFALNIFFFWTLTFSLYMSRGLRWVSCRQHIYGSCFCIHSGNLYLLVGGFSPLAFKIIIYMYDSIAIYFIVLGFGVLGLFFLLCLLSREVPLIFVVKLIWWCWTVLIFTCL